MAYDFRTRSGSPYDAQIPMYRQPVILIGFQPSDVRTTTTVIIVFVKYVSEDRPKSAYRSPTRRPSLSSPPDLFSVSVSVLSFFFLLEISAGLGIRVAIKPEYRITPPPQLLPQVGDIPRSNFQFDFDFERKVIAEAEKESQNWSRLGLENLPPRTTVSTSSVGSTADPIVSKYIASGLSRDAVPIAVAHYGDNPAKVQSFVNGYTLLREMGFSSNSVAEALVMYDNDTDKALAHFLNGSA
ncbi:hypothetical protein FNV43_RR23988 [Rhamnella rubrinervis]|uniref:UBA domain-containing protein n=1 Tax=Rhamnella rubrinervis TaxID=2594499 RepID=A0A8K0DQA6_9ROSA|nr:hypothetical protein FNV43_RR23988 [Rhamnella rubrinervis]